MCDISHSPIEAPVDRRTLLVVLLKSPRGHRYAVRHWRPQHSLSVDRSPSSWHFDWFRTDMIEASEVVKPTDW